MRRRALIAAAFALAVSLVLTASAFAHDNGEGLLGETDDRVVTFFSLGVLLFFVLVVTIGTIIQSALERRKEQKKTAALHQRMGW